MRGGGNSKPVIEQEILKQVQDDINLPLKRTYSPVHLLPHKFFAFTLAEVLITLGVIGVVAALTMPNLIANYQKRVYAVQAQKVANTIVNGLCLMMSDAGVESIDDTDFWTYLGGNRYDLNGENYTEKTIDISALNTFIKQKKYFNLIKDIELLSPESARKYKAINNSVSVDFPPNNYATCALFTTIDGAEMCFMYASDGGYLDVFVDTNGYNKLPNTVGLDCFDFYISNLATFDVSSFNHTIEMHNSNCRRGQLGDCYQSLIKNNWKISY